MTAGARSAATDDPLRTTWRPAYPVDITRTLSPLRRGRADPSYRVDASGLWRTTTTPLGPATLHLSGAAGEVRATAWGPGAEWCIESVPELLGAGDDWSGLDVSAQPLLKHSQRAHPGLHIPRTGRVFDVLAAAVLEQRVVGADARRGWRILLTQHGDPAPGPAPDGMRVPPTTVGWGRIPSWDWHRAGVDPARARTIGSAARVEPSLQRTADRGRGGPDTLRALCSVPGIGPWTAAEVMQRAHGDPDTVSVGDYHLPALVGWALIGRPVDDDGMLELLEPWRGHRQRVMRLIEESGFRLPRFGPRGRRQDHRGH
jgi:3-methyladenine DNA glycosylase/8-oxoguanine DNA glycosylase